MYENIEKEKENRIRKRETIWLISSYLFAIAIFLAGIFELFPSLHIGGFEPGNLNTFLSSLVLAGISWFIYVIFTGMIIATVEEYLDW